MPDIGDSETATLTVDPFSGTTTGVLTVYAPDGTTTTPSVSGNGTGTLTATVSYTMAGWWLLRWVVTGTGAGTEFQRVFVRVSPVFGTPPVYASVEQLKRRMAITDNGDDDLLLDALDSASREIDQHCGRRFYADSAATARVYRPFSACRVDVEDFYETAALLVKTDPEGDGTYSTTLTLDTDYVLKPFNGVVDGESGWPYWRIEAVSATTLFTAATNLPPVQVTAKWGWSSVPRPVQQACLIMAQANYKLKDVSFGAAGVADLGVVTVRQVPAAMIKLAPYRRDPMLVA